MAWPAVGRVAIMIITRRGGHTGPPGKGDGEVQVGRWTSEELQVNMRQVITKGGAFPFVMPVRGMMAVVLLLGR